MVNIREYYEKDGNLLPGFRGVAMTAEQWETFKESIDKVDDTLEELENANK